MVFYTEIIGGPEIRLLFIAEIIQNSFIFKNFSRAKPGHKVIF